MSLFFSTIDYTALTAWTGLAVAIIAVVALFLEHRRARRTLQADVMMRLNDKFFCQEMRETRKIAAK